MEHSRVKKFKNYRDSFTKVGAKDIGEANDIFTGLSKEGNNLNTNTNTLGSDKIFNELEYQKIKKKEQDRQKITKMVRFTIIGIGVIGIAIGMIILGMNAFGGK